MLLNRAGEGLDKNETIIFDKILNQIGTAILYDTTSGVIIFSQSGYYRVDWWWLTVDSTDSTTGVVFALNMNGVIYSRSVAPPVTRQVSRSALVTVADNSAILTITNAGGELVTFEDIDHQANMATMAMPV